MIDIRTSLKEGDPIAREPDLSFADVQRMRRVVLSEMIPTGNVWWPRPVLVAITIALTLAAGIALGRRLPDRGAGPVSDGRPRETGDIVSPAPGHVRQLQFSTPGGTRIIWTFNSDFSL